MLQSILIKGRSYTNAELLDSIAMRGLWNQKQASRLTRDFLSTRRDAIFIDDKINGKTTCWLPSSNWLQAKDDYTEYLWMQIDPIDGQGCYDDPARMKFNETADVASEITLHNSKDEADVYKMVRSMAELLLKMNNPNAVTGDAAETNKYEDKDIFISPEVSNRMNKLYHMAVKDDRQQTNGKKLQFI